MKLSDRVAALEGPSREIDAEIWLALNEPDWRKRKDWKKTNGWATEESPVSMVHFYTPDGLGGSLTAPAYTLSIDAAMTLARNDAEAIAILTDAINTLEDDGWPKGEWAKQLPRHISAAALKARGL